MMAQVCAKGFRPDIMRRMLCFSLFWHALDIIWVALFSVVYLMGAGAMSDAKPTQDRQATTVAPGDDSADSDEAAEGLAATSSAWGSRCC